MFVSLIRETNRLLSKGMANIWAAKQQFKKLILGKSDAYTQKFNFLSLKGFYPG